MPVRLSILSVAVGIVMLLLGWWILTSFSPSPRIRKVLPQTGRTIHREKVALYDLRFHGIPFGSAVHDLRIGEEFVIAGDIKVRPDQLPSRDALYMLNIWWRPKGTTETEWLKSDPRKWIIALGNSDPFKFKFHIDAKSFQPGEYEMRAYLKILDPEGEGDSIDCLSVAELRVLP